LKHKIGDEIRIAYGKPSKRIWVRIAATIAGGDLIAIDRQGRFYTTWWEVNAEKSAQLCIGQRHWRRYEKGIYYLRRSLLLAMAQTRSNKIPSLSNLLQLCRKTQTTIFTFSGKNDLKRLEALSGQFEALQDFLKGRRRWPLKDSRDQLNFFLLFKDRLGRVNVGVLQARLSTIDRRFMAELQHLTGWLPHYAARFESVYNLQLDLQKQVQQMAQSLSAMTTHQAFQTGQTDEKQIKGLIAAMKRNLRVIKALSVIKPFDRWAKMCAKDLAQAKQQTGRKKFQAACDNLKKVVRSSQLRCLGFTLEELIAEISLSLAMKNINQKWLLEVISTLLLSLKMIDDSDFDEPIADRVSQILTQAKQAIKEMDAEDLTAFIKAKRLLKEAADLI